MKLFRNRYILGGLCVCAAAVFAFIILPSINKSKEATAFVLRASAHIEAGAEIRDKDLELVEVGSYNLPKGVLDNKSLVVGSYAAAPIMAGDYIFNSKISSERFSSLMEQVMGDGNYLLTVTLASTAAGVGGHLQAGDTVSLYRYTPESEEYVTDPDGFQYKTTAPARVSILTENVVLYAMENANAETIIADNPNEGQFVSDKLVPKTATLIVTGEQAKAIIQAEYSDKIHLVFISRGV